MLSADEATAEAIRRAFDEGGELAGVVEFKRHFPLISDHAKARECVRIIAGWKPLSAAGDRASVGDTQAPDPGRPRPIPPPMPNPGKREAPERDDPEEPERDKPPLPPWRNA